MKLNDYSNFCFEHLEYYTLEDIINLLNIFELRVFDVSYNKVNGGSLRVFACHKDSDYKTLPSVKKAVKEERKYFKTKESTLESFYERVEQLSFELLELLVQLKDDGKKVYVMGASTKGNVILQYANITKDLVPFAAEVNKDKFGLKTPGSDITIISEEQALKEHPDYFLVLPYTFRDFLIKKHQDYLNSGGQFIFPLPIVQIVGKDS
jgi:hypothetical protein